MAVLFYSSCMGKNLRCKNQRHRTAKQCGSNFGGLAAAQKDGLMSHQDVMIAHVTPKIQKWDKGKRVISFYNIDLDKLTEWAKSSSYYAGALKFYLRVREKNLNQLTNKQTNWLERLCLQLALEKCKPAAVKIWTKEEIAALNAKKK